jgi:hypothetical protein
MVDCATEHNQHIASVQTAKPEKATQANVFRHRCMAPRITTVRLVSRSTQEKAVLKPAINNPEAGRVPACNKEIVYRNNIRIVFRRTRKTHQATKAAENSTGLPTRPGYPSLAQV